MSIARSKASCTRCRWLPYLNVDVQPKMPTQSQLTNIKCTTRGQKPSWGRAATRWPALEDTPPVTQDVDHPDIRGSATTAQSLAFTIYFKLHIKMHTHTHMSILFSPILSTKTKHIRDPYRPVVWIALTILYVHFIIEILKIVVLFIWAH